MKIKPEDYTVIQKWVSDCIKFYNVTNKCEEGYKEKGLTPMRFRWDVLHQTSRYVRDYTEGEILLGDGIGMKGLTAVYSYANDTHIDTALRSILKELGFEWAAIKE